MVDVSKYQPEELKVSTAGNVLTIEGKQAEIVGKSNAEAGCSA